MREIEKELLQSQKLIDMTFGAKHTYVCMVAESNGNSEFEFSHQTAAEYGIPDNTLRAAVKQLVESGFIRVKENGRESRKANIYEFADQRKSGLSDIKRQYYRNYYQKNRERIRANQERYWERKAQNAEA